VVVVGGGTAGLATAYQLHQLGVPFLLLEAGARVGGVIFSEPVGDYVIDGGPDSLLIQKPEAIKLCQEVGLGDRLVPTKPPRLAYIQRGGRLHALPEGSVLGIPTRVGPFIRTSLFTWPGKLRMGAEMFVPRKENDDDESVGGFMRRRFGTEAVDYIAEPLLAGIHAGDVDRLSVKALFPRFTAAEREHGSLLRAFRRQPRPPGSADGVFRSLPGGLSELVQAIERTLPADSIVRNAAVEHIDRDGETLVVRSARETFRSSAVVLATPAYATAPMIRTLAPALARHCDEIPYASAVTVAMAFRREAVGHPLNGSGFVVPRAEKTGILAGSWLSSKWPNRAPEGRALMRAFIGDARDPRALERTDDELIAIAIGALAPLLHISGTPELTRVYRWPRSNAQHVVGHLDRMAAMERELAAQPGLYVTGSAYRGVGIPDCVADGRATARQVAAALHRQPTTA
jgi:oxygen-dependent protoporphyrinogen oxidase